MIFDYYELLYFVFCLYSRKGGIHQCPTFCTCDVLLKMFTLWLEHTSRSRISPAISVLTKEQFKLNFFLHEAVSPIWTNFFLISKMRKPVPKVSLQYHIVYTTFIPVDTIKYSADFTIKSMNNGTSRLKNLKTTSVGLLGF